MAIADAELEVSGERGDVIDSLQGAIETPRDECAVRGRNVFVGSSESPTITITRYEEVNGALVEGQTVSFLNLGVTSTAGQIALISDTKAYYLDRGTLQIVIWNPSERRPTVFTMPRTGTGTGGSPAPRGRRFEPSASHQHWPRLVLVEGF